MPSKPALIGLLLVSMVTASRADDPPDDDDPPPRVALALTESALVLGLTWVGYEATIDQQRGDFDLAWDWPSWRRKLTFDAVRFDTNTWAVNTVRHPLLFVLQYHIGRTNHFGMLYSEVLAAGTGVLWEYVFEYREYPSINDMIINASTAIEVGEPLWQIGQLWRGGVMTVGDRVKTTLFSPLDSISDLTTNRCCRWYRPRAWRSWDLYAGVLASNDRTDAAFSGDVDLVADRHYVSSVPGSWPIKAGSWSRIRGQLQIGKADSGTDIVSSQVESRTAFAGHYTQDESGNGQFYGLGTAFTYRRDRLADSWDHVAIAHIVGPQLQLSHRTPTFAVRWDAAAYGDFALIDAHVFGLGNPFPPEPMTSLLQSQGYYAGMGASVATRLRFDTIRWFLDGEASAHGIGQINGADRGNDSTVNPRPVASSTAMTVPPDPHGAADLRVYWRAKLGYRIGHWGLAGIAEGAWRRGSWHDLHRSTSDTMIGLLGIIAL